MNSIPVQDRRSWYVLGLLVCVYSVNWMDRYVLVILMEPLKHDLGLSDTELGLLTGFGFAVIYSLAGIPIARWADARSRRSIIAAGLAFWSLMTMASGLARSFVHLFVARLGVAVGEAACSPPAHSLICDYFAPERRATALAIYGLGISIGMSLGLIVGGWVSELWGWRAAFFIFGAPGLLLAVVVRLTVREPARGQTDREAVDTAHYPFREALSYLLTQRVYVAAVLALALFSFGSTAFEVWAPTYLIRLHDMGTAAAGTWSGAIEGVAGVTGTLCGGLLADRLGSRDVRWYLWLPTGAVVLMIPLILLFLSVDGGWLFPLYFAVVLCLACYMAPMVAAVLKVTPSRMRALASAVMFLVLNLIGSGGGAFAVGFLNDLFAAPFGASAIRYSISATLLVSMIGIPLALYAAAQLSLEHSSREVAIAR